MPGSVIVAGARTPIGKLSGALAPFSAAELGGFAIRAALERAGAQPEEVDYVIDKMVQVVSKLRELSPLYEMAKEGIDISKVKWQTA